MNEEISPMDHIDLNRFMAQDMPEPTPEPYTRPDAVNGFAPGDRVAIVNCELAGAYGKVDFASGGCLPEFCRSKCLLVWVQLMATPEGAEADPSRQSWDNPDVKRFMVEEVTHVD